MSKVESINTIKFGGEYHPPGSILELPEAEAARLIKLGAAKLVEEPQAAPAPVEPAPEPEKETPSAEPDKTDKPETPQAKPAKGKGKK